MVFEYRAPDWAQYRMDYRRPFAQLESIENEIRVVDEALAVLVDANILPHKNYDPDQFLRFRQAVQQTFDIPWTAISPRVQRLLWAINAIAQPRTVLAAGIFCGFTFALNIGAAAGPGACYQANDLVGIEIKPAEAARAEQNIRQIDPEGKARVVAADAVDFLRTYPNEVSLLYLDADGTPEKGKGIYLEILEAGYNRIPSGGIVLAHNSVNARRRLEDYLAYVRDPVRFRASVNVILDPEGLEASIK
ncbi:MAG: hypothetical protein QHI38_00255 [Armatimonadota bacterium]|nr:hypothetical protein [Armatimonadota bacterium]